MPAHTRIALETGKSWTFATALDWPGWCRRGKGGDEGAMQALEDYSGRYRALVGRSFRPGPYDVVGRIESGMYADFGAPGASGPWDELPLPAGERRRLLALLAACWEGFDAVVASAPAALAKGPRGGGRDRDPIADHVREAERSYAGRSGLRVPPRTPWPEQREAILAALADPAPGARWPSRYAINRIAWHVTDHLWEIEDKS